MSVATTEIKGLNNVRVRVPKIKSKTQNSFPVFEKHDWVPDEEATSCMRCSEKFTRFKRKHHCRSCGKLFCNKCCAEKIPLPHFGMSEPQKVCEDCSHTSRLIHKLRSTDSAEKHEALSGFLQLVNSADLFKVVECGYFHLIMSYELENDIAAMELISTMIHLTAQETWLNAFLIEIGVLRTLRSILTAGVGYHHLLNDSLSALHLLCKDVQIRNEAIREGVIDPLIPVLGITGTSAALAAHILLLLLSNFDVHDFILKSHPQILPSLFKGLQVEDFQMQGAITKMMVYLSAGSDAARQMLLLEDERHGFPLKYLLKGSSSEILLNTACAIANFATVPKEEIGYRYIKEIYDLLIIVQKDSGSLDLVTQLIRGLANFAEIQSNHVLLLPRLSQSMQSILSSAEETHKYHLCRLILFLLTSEVTHSNNFLFSDGLEEFLNTLLHLPGVCDFLNKSLLRKVSKLSVCT